MPHAVNSIYAEPQSDQETVNGGEYGGTEPKSKTKSKVKDKVQRLVLCFDGTGNKFQGDESDTNIVKIYQMLQKNEKGQYHYYQPGIGTYIKGQSGDSSGVGFWSKLKSKVYSTWDLGVGASFVDHVLAGYQFIMRYYSKHDHIYIFGFSRGAYTARFLAEMIHNIGLLSKGNEEMVHFAWETFSKYQISRANYPPTRADRDVEEYMNKFKKTFARPDVKIHFLGLFDCVNSVGQFEIPLYRTSYQVVAVPAATHIRHAVSIHERRLKFKPALFVLDETAKKNVDLKEVWFAGNHGDVGGGWGLENGQKHLLSDTPLEWMIEEVLNLPNSENRLAFETTDVKARQEEEYSFPEPNVAPASASWDIRRRTTAPHDMLKMGHGVSMLTTFLWWLFEVIPLFTRLELEKGKWVPRRLPPNMGAPRDIPVNAEIHHSVDDMVRAGILDEAPRKGGDNPHLNLDLPSTKSITDALYNLRRKKLDNKQNNHTRSLVSNGTANGTAGSDWTETDVVKAKEY